MRSYLIGGPRRVDGCTVLCTTIYLFFTIKECNKISVLLEVLACVCCGWMGLAVI